MPYDYMRRMFSVDDYGEPRADSPRAPYPQAGPYPQPTRQPQRPPEDATSDAGGSVPTPAASPAPTGSPSGGPVATMTGGAAPMSANGPQTGGTGGYGFTNLASYLYANPMGTGPGSGYAPTPTGFKPEQFNPQIHGYSPTADYTAGMAGVDNSLNAAYGRTGYPVQAAAQPPAPTQIPQAPPIGSPGPEGGDERNQDKRRPYPTPPRERGVPARKGLGGR